MALVQSLTFDELRLTIKFEKFVKVTSLVNGAFHLIDSHNHSVAFDAIDQFDDYNSISRTLILSFAGQTLPAETYTFTISGLLDAANVLIPDYTVTFIAGDATPTVITEPVPDPIEITDNSIRSSIFENPEAVFAANPLFYVVEVDPPDLDLYVPLDYNNGRVTITFSGRPDSAFLNARYFKVQRKIVQRMPARWENIPVEISLDSVTADVYLDFPSIDATPVYHAPGVTYFVEGYKYRIILSKEIGN